MLNMFFDGLCIVCHAHLSQPVQCWVVTLCETNVTTSHTRFPVLTQYLVLKIRVTEASILVSALRLFVDCYAPGLTLHLSCDTIIFTATTILLYTSAFPTAVASSANPDPQSQEPRD